jgi:hypothetical protein
MVRSVSPCLKASFEKYADQMDSQMKLLREAKFPRPIIWEINWHELKQIGSSKRKNWDTITLAKKPPN